MSVIGEFTVKSDDFALHHSLTEAPHMIVEIERVVATLEDHVMPYFWVSGADQAEFEAAFHDDSSVQNIAAIDAIAGARLYRAEWTENVETIVYAYIEIGATILQAIGRDENWELRMRFDDRDKLSEFQEYCNERGISFELNSLKEQEQPMASAQYDLTTKQRETLVTALEAGYYDIPQETTMSELADEFGSPSKPSRNAFMPATRTSSGAPSLSVIPTTKTDDRSPAREPFIHCLYNRLCHRHGGRK